MADRSPDMHRLHDEVERAVVDTLEDEDWKTIWADDIMEYGQPTKRNGYRPDIAAINDETHLVIEIETDPRDDEDQRQAFKDWTSKEIERIYRGILAKEEGDWMRFESSVYITS